MTVPAVLRSASRGGMFWRRLLDSRDLKSSITEVGSYTYHHCHHPSFQKLETQPCVDCAAAPAVVNQQAKKKKGKFLYLAGLTALVGPSAVQRAVNKSRLSLFMLQQALSSTR
jgi:hypothetical protein